MAKPPRSIFLLLFSLSVALGRLPNVPSYEEYLRMAAASIHQRLSNNSSHVNFADLKFPFHDSEGNNYLENWTPKKLARKLSEDPSAMKEINKFSKFDICGMFRPNVSLECCSNLQSIFTAATKRGQWAMQMIDAFGKPPSGILKGNFMFSGSYDECLATVVPAMGANQFQPKYCQINFPQKPAGFLTAQLVIKYAVCIPNTCTPEEINFIVHKGIHLLLKRDDVNSYVSCPGKPKYDAKAISAITICSIFLALLLSGTLYDIIFIQLDLPERFSSREGLTAVKDITYTTQLSYDEPNGDVGKKPIIPPNKEDPSWFAKFLLCFSIHKNASKLLKTELSKGSLTSLHGIRFISMTWVILGHTYAFGMAIWSNSSDSLHMMSRFTFQAVGNATVSVDTFFMISGLLVVYGVMNLMEANDGKMNWIYFYVHRYWRLTPPYMLVLMVFATLMRYWGDGPYWPEYGFQPDSCKNTWWYNLLYINNFINNECMAWTWYLANDMQFYVISPLILIFLYKKPKIGFGILSILMLAQLITCGLIMKINNYSGLLSLGYFSNVYVKPYTRIGAYLIGMLYGYLLFKTKCKMVLNEYLVALMWLVSTISAIAVLYGLYDSYHGSVLSSEVSALYETVHRIVWAICVGWVIYACVSGYGGFVNTLLSWKAFIPLSRLTYSAYLVHPVVILTFYLSTRYPIYLTDFEAIYLFFGHLVLSFLVAFVVSMAFESPMIALESLVRGKNKN